MNTVKELARRVAVEIVVATASTALISTMRSAFNEWRHNRNKKNNEKPIHQ